MIGMRRLFSNLLAFINTMSMRKLMGFIAALLMTACTDAGTTDCSEASRL